MEREIVRTTEEDEWEYCGGDYYYEPEWYEVKLLKQIIKNVYGWKS